MKICILAAGAGGMCCGSCMRDNALAAALMRDGHEVTLVPLYTPMKTDTPDVSTGNVFFGGINIYLQHASRLFRRTPRFLDWMFDRTWMLNAAARYGTDKPVSELGGLTLDLLRGEAGAMVKEVRRLSNFLKGQIKPDVVTLPNLMFMGAARIFREELKIPVVAELTGEDIFLDALSEPYRSQAREVIRERIGAVSRFVATSNYYAAQMSDYLAIPPEKIAVVYPGLAREFLAAVDGPSPKSNGRPPTIGYLARICPEKGIERLVDAMIELRAMPGMSNVQLRCAGYLGKRDAAFFEKLKGRVERSALRGGMTYLGEVDQPEKIALLRSVDVFSVPSVYPESKGIYVLEALAAGLPAVQPAHGSFPELLDKTGGGTLTAPGDATAHAKGLADMLGDPERCAKHGESGRRAVHEQFTDARMAQQMLKIYQEAQA